jgi:hypothetical protein
LGSRTAPIILVVVGLLAPLTAATAWAVELRDAELVAAGSPVLQNGTGTVRLEDGRLGRPAVPLPEPGALWQLGSGIGLLALLARRRHPRVLAAVAEALDRERNHDMKKPASRSCAHWLVGLVLTLLAWPAVAQVPQDMTYTGRLVDNLGAPLEGPVKLELRIFDAESGGTQLYAEKHLGVALDATGGFSVQLGLGASPSGTFDADLFSEVDRWLEVVVDAQLLSPRQIIGAVPWALVAERANEVVRDPKAPRFEDCGDGTVADHQTGLQWEKKTGAWTLAIYLVCETEGCPDPHGVNNRYDWSNTGWDPDGSAFADFLGKLNDLPPASDCFAGHCDWRLPIIGELRTILIGPKAAPGQATTCPAAPCIDPGFAAVGGPTASSFHWSASTDARFPAFAWLASFASGNVVNANKETVHTYVRAD